MIPGMEYLPVAGLTRTAARCAKGVAKHGAYEALPVRERVEKIRRHLRAILMGDVSEDHYAAIAANALFAMEQQRLDEEPR